MSSVNKEYLERNLKNFYNEKIKPNLNYSESNIIKKNNLFCFLNDYSKSITNFTIEKKDCRLIFNGKKETSSTYQSDVLALNSGKYVVYVKIEGDFTYDPTGTYMNTIETFDGRINLSGVDYSLKDYSDGVLGQYRIDVNIDVTTNLSFKLFVNKNYTFNGYTVNILVQEITSEDNFVINFDKYIYLQKITNDNLSLSKNILYFSNNGDDNNIGTIPQSPKKNPNKYSVIPNTTLLLKSGDVFAINMELVGSGNTISSYGGTTKPIITGIRKASNKFTLQAESTDIYTAILDEEIGTIMIDDNINWKRRMENVLNNEGEYYFDVTTKTLYYKTAIDPTEKDIYYTLGKHCININNATNVTIDGIEIYGFGRNGISVVNNCSNIIIRNCYVHHIGGSILLSKYGNAIQIWMNNTHNVYVCNNVISDVYDAGITAQVSSDCTMYGDSSDIFFIKNIVRNAYYSIEHFNSSVNMCSNIVYKENLLLNGKDVTEGYRETSNQNFGAFMCLWTTAGADDSVYLENNTCVYSDLYGVSFNKNTKDKWHFKNNLFITNNETNIKNPTYYSGEDTFLIESNVSKGDVAYYLIEAKNKITFDNFYEYYIK